MPLTNPRTLAEEETRRAVKLYLVAESHQAGVYARKNAACPGDASYEEDARWTKWTDVATYAASEARQHLLSIIQVWRPDLRGLTALDHLGTKLRPRGLVVDGVLYVAAVEDNDADTLALVVVPMADVVSLDDETE